MQLHEKLEALKASPLLSALDNDELSIIAPVAHPFIYDEDALILQQGTVPGRLYLMACGAVAASNNGVLVREFQAPITLGAANILLDYESNFMWRASSRGTQGLFIRRNHFLTIAHQCPHILGIFFGQDFHSQGEDGVI